MFEDCGNCIAMEQSGYISKWQNLLLTLTSYYYSITNQHQEEYLVMEIERKFLIQKLEKLPFSPFDYPHKELEQGYLCTAPVIRIRREDDDYVLT